MQPKNQGLPWTKEDTERIKAYFEKGKSPSYIAAKMHRTRLSIKTKLCSMGLLKRVRHLDCEKPHKGVWSEPKEDGALQRAIRILGARYRYDKQLGCIVDGKIVMVQDVIKISGVRKGGK